MTLGNLGWMPEAMANNVKMVVFQPDIARPLLSFQLDVTLRDHPPLLVGHFGKTNNKILKKSTEE